MLKTSFLTYLYHSYLHHIYMPTTSLIKSARCEFIHLTSRPGGQETLGFPFKPLLSMQKQLTHWDYLCISIYQILCYHMELGY